MNVVPIVQARMGSQRLPGKVLELIGLYPAIGHIYKRLEDLNPVLAIPATAENDPLADYLNTLDAPCFRWDGPENDVLGRYYHCAQTFNADVVVRITGDCPFVDPELVGKVLKARNNGFQYASNVGMARSYPRGLDVEAFTIQALEAAYYTTGKPYDREHVTPWMRRVYVPGVVCSPSWYGDLRWVLDTEADLAWFREIAKATDVRPPHPTTKELLRLLARRGDLLRYEPLQGTAA
jgi:spore coat polysaccharide biosynthesis protein SpsF (cytidylyltransferase family)